MKGNLWNFWNSFWRTLLFLALYSINPSSFNSLKLIISLVITPPRSGLAFLVPQFGQDFDRKPEKTCDDSRIHQSWKLTVNLLQFHDCRQKTVDHLGQRKRPWYSRHNELYAHVSTLYPPSLTGVTQKWAKVDVKHEWVCISAEEFWA